MGFFLGFFGQKEMHIFRSEGCAFWFYLSSVFVLFELGRCYVGVRAVLGGCYYFGLVGLFL